MPQQAQQQRRAPPLAGRPPFATDEDDSVYDQPPAPRQRPPKQQEKRNTERDSMYSAWDNYLQNEKDRPQSGAGGIGMGLMALDDSDDDDEPQPRRPQQKSQSPASVPTKSNGQQPASGNRNVPTNSPPTNRDMSEKSRQAQNPPMSSVPGQGILTRPHPTPAVIPAPIAPSMNVVARTPPPMQHPMPRQAPGVQRPAAAALRVDINPRAPAPAFMQAPNPNQSPSPSNNPFPLNAPSTPITPVFALPATTGRKVEFADEAILRGNSEETLLPRNTAKGAEFWHRFSVVANEGVRSKGSKSSWLKRYEGGRNRMSRWVWCISIFLLLLIGGAIGVGWYFTHNNSPSLPVAVGGSANEAATISATTHGATPTPSNTSRTLIAPPAVETKRALPDSFVMPRRTNNSNISLKRSPRAVHQRRRKNRLDGLN